MTTPPPDLPESWDAEDAEVKRPRSRVLMIVIGVVVALVVVGFGVWFAVNWSSGGARQADVDSALSRLGGATSVAPVVGELRPAQGLYRYRGSGTDQLVTPPKEQTEGPEMPATVRQQSNGCWTFRTSAESGRFNKLKTP